jgi:hypothetical protein
VIVVATAQGLRDLDSGSVELPQRDVRFAARGASERWAIADGGHAVLHREDAARSWSVVARLGADAGVVMQPLGAHRCLVGTEGAHVLRIDGEGVHRLLSFDDVPGRGGWYNPAAADRPDVWSMAALGEAVFASVHVGGLWRSEDDGDTWESALAPEVDVHQVAAGSGAVVVAAADGFGVSRDFGRTWSWTTDGLHASYLQSVIIDGDECFVGASSGPFGDDGTVYRAARIGNRFESRFRGGPGRFMPISPHYLVSDGTTLAVAEWNSNEVFISLDDGESWSASAREFPDIRSLAAF